MAKVLSVHQTAEELGVHYNSVYNLIKENKLKCIRIGRTIRIPYQSLEEFIKEEMKQIND